MPLIESPIDGKPMRQVIRYGIEVDVCQTSGGIWLDKGELEKLVTLIREETREEDAAFTHRERSRLRAHRRAVEDDDDDHGADHPRRRSRLSDLFDF